MRLDRRRSRSIRPFPLVSVLAVLLCTGCDPTEPRPGSSDDAVAADSSSVEPPDGAEGADTPQGDSVADDAGGTKDGVSAPTVTAGGCNPLAEEWDCLLPYPSDVFTLPDDTLPGGRRVAIPASALPKDVNGATVDLLADHPADGFSVLAQIVAFIPGGIDEEPLVFHTDDRTRTLAATSPTLLLDAETREPVLHFAEVDPKVPAEKGAALVIRPLARLASRHRYVVVLHGLVRPDGSEVPPPDGFRRLRDGETWGDPVLSGLASHFDDAVFPVIEAAGVERSEVQLAWDFTTESDENVTGDLLAIRADAMKRMETEPPAVTDVSVEEDPSEHIARKVTGNLTVPLYQDSPEPGSVIARDASGAPIANGTVAVPFTLLIPKSVWSGALPHPARLLQFGHGFFGSREEIEGDFVSPFADETGMVVIGVDWWGMSSPDVAVVLENLFTDMSHGLRFTERIHQGMVNFMAVTYAARGPLAELAELQLEGAPVYDPDHVYFYGISQGHILGGTYVTLSPHIERAMFSVGGAGFGLMMSRAAPFAGFMALIDNRLEYDTLATLKVVLLMQTTLDRIDPITYLPHLRSDTLEGCPPVRHVLQHVGIGDTSVPNLASHVFARSAGLPELAPVPRELAGIEAKPGPIADSAMVEFDFGVEIPDIPARPVTKENEVHEGVRRLPASIEQVDGFLRPDGVIEQTCSGACDPE